MNYTRGERPKRPISRVTERRGGVVRVRSRAAKKKKKIKIKLKSSSSGHYAFRRRAKLRTTRPVAGRRRPARRMGFSPGQRLQRAKQFEFPAPFRTTFVGTTIMAHGAEEKKKRN